MRVRHGLGAWLTKGFGVAEMAQERVPERCRLPPSSLTCLFSLATHIGLTDLNLSYLKGSIHFLENSLAIRIVFM